MASPKRYRIRNQNTPLNLKLRIWAGSIIHHGRSRGGKADQVFRLPNRQIAKLRCIPNELDAMEFVAKHTTIPIPTIREIYDYGSGQHIVMDEAPGGDVEVHYGQMTPEQIVTFGRELADCLAQLRRIPAPSPGFIGSVKQEANNDHRLSGTPFGPFTNIADFHTYLRFGRPLTHWENEPDVMKVHSVPENYCTNFSHAELNPFNIMVKDGHITAIIDWEFAGWYPEYWDFTKMHWCARPLWNNFYKAIEGEAGIVRYEDELLAEQAIWARTHPWSYDDPQWQPGDDEKAAQERAEQEAYREKLRNSPSTKHLKHLYAAGEYPY